MFKAILFYVGLGFALAFAQYVGGRIMLPEMGLTAPGFGPWLALSLLVEMPAVVVAALLDEARKPSWSLR